MLNKLDITKIVPDENLPKSSHSTLYLYSNENSDNNEYLIKKIQAKDFKEFQQAMQPVILGYKLKHPSIVPVIDYNAEQAEESGYNLYIQMPRMQANLLDLLEQTKATEVKVTKVELVRHFYTLVSGLNYLHEQKISHGNIKPTNILIDKEGRLALSDAGTIPRTEGSQAEGELSLNQLYLAPEIFSKPEERGAQDLYKGDIWSLGLIVVLLFLQKPSLIQELNVSENKEEFIVTVIDEITEAIGEESANVVKQMLVLEPEKRITIKEVKKMLDIQMGNVPENEGEGENKLLVAIDENYFPSVIKNKDGDRLLLENWDALRQGMEDDWKNGFKLQLEEALSVKANGINVDDEQLCSFMNDLGMKLATYGFDLRVLELGLAAETLTSEGVKFLGANISQTPNLKNLQYLSLNLSKTPFIPIYKIENGAVKELVMKICKNLTGLKSFSLCLSEYSKLTEDVIEDIAKNVGQNLVHLKQLKFDFSWCGEITDKAIRALSSQLRPLKNLQYLSLDLRRCWKISDSGLKDFSETICANMIHLQSLELYFYACSQVTDKGINALGLSIFNHLKELRHLTINLHQCEKVTENIKDALRQKLSFVLKLDIF